MVGIDIGRACVAEGLAGEARQRCRVLPTVGAAEGVEVALVELGAALAGDEVLDMEGRERLGRRVRFANPGRQCDTARYSLYPRSPARLPALIGSDACRESVR